MNSFENFENNQKFVILEELAQDNEKRKHIICMEEILEYCEKRYEINEDIVDVNIEMIESNHFENDYSFEGCKYFTVKTIKVEWESHKNAFMHVFINISNVKKLEKEKASNKCLHIMFSSISHEFRTPLNAFMNALQLIKLNFESIEYILIEKGLDLRTRKDRESMQRNITTATVSSKILASLTEDILDFAKIEADMFNLNEKPFEIGVLINEIEFIFENQCKQKGIWFRVKCEERLRRMMFYSDADRIRQILMNLISNSYKFTNYGGITIAFAMIQSSRDNNSRFLKIKVIDTGIGISEDDKKGLFQVFGMIHKYRDEFNMKGTGLGLTISQKLVKMLGGKINMESVVNFGTTVTFTVKERPSLNCLDEDKNLVFKEESKSNSNQVNMTFLCHQEPHPQPNLCNLDASIMLEVLNEAKALKARITSINKPQNPRTIFTIENNFNLNIN